MAGKRIASPIDPFDDVAEFAADAIADTERVRALLVAAARRREALSYSELLFQLGHRFTRPKMRAVCRTLDAIDTQGAAKNEPGLAVLVVRESDGLPGQGWWVEGPPRREGYQGAWTGAEATAFVTGLQERVFDFWKARRAPAAVTRPRARER